MIRDIICCFLKEFETGHCAFYNYNIKTAYIHNNYDYIIILYTVLILRQFN